MISDFVLAFFLPGAHIWCYKHPNIVHQSECNRDNLAYWFTYWAYDMGTGRLSARMIECWQWIVKEKKKKTTTAITNHQPWLVGLHIPLPSLSLSPHRFVGWYKIIIHEEAIITHNNQCNRSMKLMLMYVCADLRTHTHTRPVRFRRPKWMGAISLPNENTPYN